MKWIVTHKTKNPTENKTKWNIVFTFIPNHCTVLHLFFIFLKKKNQIKRERAKSEVNSWDTNSFNLSFTFSSNIIRCSECFIAKVVKASTTLNQYKRFFSLFSSDFKRTQNKNWVRDGYKSVIDTNCAYSVLVIDFYFLLFLFPIFLVCLFYGYTCCANRNELCAFGSQWMKTSRQRMRIQRTKAMANENFCL